MTNTIERLASYGPNTNRELSQTEIDERFEAMITPEIAASLRRELKEIGNQFDGEEVPEISQDDAIEAYGETVAPALHELASVDERAPDIREAIEDGRLKPGDLVDLQAEKIKSLTGILDGYTDIFMESPREAFVFQVEAMRALYDGRCEKYTDGNLAIERFVTRDATRTRADLDIKHITYPDGRWRLSVESPTQNTYAGERHFDDPFYIEVNSAGKFKLSQEARYGLTQPITESEDPDQYDRRLRSFFHDSIVATGLSFERTPEDIAACDKQALQFLSEKKQLQSEKRLAVLIPSNAPKISH